MKIFYYLDEQGKFVSEDGKNRYSCKQGKELREFLKTDEGKGKHFAVEKDDRGNSIGVEITDKKAIAQEHRRNNKKYYVKGVKEKLDISECSMEKMIDEEFVSGENILVSDEISPEERVIERENIENLHNVLKRLSPKELELISLLYLSVEKMTETQLAELKGVSQQAIHKAKINILKKLKTFLEN